MKYNFFCFWVIYSLFLGAGFAQNESSLDSLNFFERYKEKKHQKRLLQKRYSTQGTYLLADVAYDTKMSPLLYTGVGIGFRTGNHIESDTWLNLDRFDFMVGAQSSVDLFSQFTPRFMGSHAYLKWLNIKSEKYRMAVGGGFRYAYSARVNPSLGNSTYHHDIFGSLISSYYLRRNLHFNNKTMFLDFLADMAIVSVVNRHPAYSVIGTFNTYTRPIGGFTHFTFSMGLTIPRSRYTNENLLRFSYDWEMYGMAEFERSKLLRMSNHRIGATYYFKK